MTRISGLISAYSKTGTMVWYSEAIDEIAKREKLIEQMADHINILTEALKLMTKPFGGIHGEEGLDMLENSKILIAEAKTMTK
jgi:hypothetical protein